ncbi:MAG: hypothetical protein JSS00_06430 [Proteobacteria bacterium]|nr:hypothetical protein [Pseudomonadota bacterium]
MADKWVEIGGYIGPDRRKRPGPKRLMDRRRRDESGAPPTVSALLRRLRVQLLGIYSTDDRLRVLQVLNGAICEAQRQRMYECANALKRADHVLRSGPAGAVATADAALQEAIGLAADGR